MLSFVEQGTAYANDVGYGDDSFFSGLEGMLTRALALLQQSTQELRDSLEQRLIRLADSARHLGWDMAISLLKQLAKPLSQTKQTRRVRPALTRSVRL